MKSLGRLGLESLEVVKANSANLSSKVGSGSTSYRYKSATFSGFPSTSSIHLSLSHFSISLDWICIHTSDQLVQVTFYLRSIKPPSLAQSLHSLYNTFVDITNPLNLLHHEVRCCSSGLGHIGPG